MTVIYVYGDLSLGDPYLKRQGCKVLRMLVKNIRKGVQNPFKEPFKGFGNAYTGPDKVLSRSLKAFQRCLKAF